MYDLRIELTLRNLKTIKLWFFFISKDRELTREDHQTITKINALTIAEQEHQEYLKRFKK
jgi:hypothetical protein